MGWIYYTNISPYEIPKNSFNEAFEICFKQCLINKDKLTNKFSKNECYVFSIRTDNDYDKIMCNDGRYYLRSLFLKNKTFKKRLIDYYRPLGIYVKGPTKFVKSDGTDTNRWIIELSPNHYHINY